MRFVLAALLWVFASPVAAQYWASQEACAFDPKAQYGDGFERDVLKELTATARQTQNGLGRYWKITAPNGAVSHLLGTWHSTRIEVLNLPDQVEAEIARARLVAPEIVYTQGDRNAVTLRLKADGFFRDPNRPFQLEDYGFPDEVNLWIRQRTDAIGWDGAAGDFLTPYGLLSLLFSHPCDDFAYGFYPILDDRIQMLGELGGAQLLSLEPPEALQRHLMKNQDSGLAEAMILNFASYLNPELYAPGTPDLVNYYLWGEIGFLRAWDLKVVEMAMEPVLAEEVLRRTDDYLIDERNANFLQKIRPELEKGSVFKAVGAFHLPGPKGLVTLLRSLGFEVVRVPLPGECL
ncbi:MAG: TraB/GumN family protein [Pseudomonadota bacterium]